ncbi:MAG TPA: hypothetical protein VF678_12700 [bacterium]
MNYKIWGAVFSSAALGTSLCILALIIGDTVVEKALNFTVLASTASAGWLIGVFLSPYGKTEATKFPVYAGAVSTFASGYLVSKVDRLLEKWLQPEALAAITPLIGFRVLGGLTALFVAIVITYAMRSYAK